MFARTMYAVAAWCFLLLAACGNTTVSTSCADNPVGCICKNDAACGGANPRCELRTGKCVPCLMTNDNCGGGTHCINDGGKYMCGMGCVTTADCPKAGGVQPVCCAGTCIDTTKSSDNCGACGNTCKNGPNSKVACAGGTCAITGCDAGFDDCDRNPANGCETATGTDIRSCGGCGIVCFVGANATPACTAGKCGGTCVMGYADCDNNLANGCEVDVSKDNNNCGGCGTKCVPAMNAPMTVCRAGKCVAATCGGWFGDCDKDAANGCESDTQTDVKNCGACGNACPAAQNGMAACSFGQCVIGGCNAGFGDCDKSNKNGCEKAITADVNNCGACGNICAAPNAIMDCAAGKCIVSACNAGFTDCNMAAKDGCEANLNNDIKNCGACGMTCPAPANADILCKVGVCGVGACKPGFADCDKDPMTGCEADINSLQNCGGCGLVCPGYANASNQCLGGKCTIKTCNPGFENCDNNLANGCEKNLNTDPANCGTCGIACTYKNASGACGMGKCSMGACNANFADCNKSDMDGCEIATDSDPKNCGACGNVCGMNVPNCINGKCSNSVHNSLQWNGFNQFGAWGCLAYVNNSYIDDFDWIDVGARTWKSCMLEASKRGAMVQNPIDADWNSPGWFGHRNLANAMTGNWSSYTSAAIVNNNTCIVLRPRANGANRGVVLANSISYDGNGWTYQDYGLKYYYECQDLAAKAGASIITPYTLGIAPGVAGDNYWMGIVDICAQVCWTEKTGNNYVCEYPYDPDIGTQHKCMVGWMDN